MNSNPSVPKTVTQGKTQSNSSPDKLPGDQVKQIKPSQWSFMYYHLKPMCQHSVLLVFFLHRFCHIFATILPLPSSPNPEKTKPTCLGKY